MISYIEHQSERDLQQILSLQGRNLKANVSLEERFNEGFVTLRYSLSELEEVCIPYKHVIAKEEDSLVGYALVVVPKPNLAKSELLKIMHKVHTCPIDGRNVLHDDYIIMGQVCVAKNYRGSGIFRNLYYTMANYFEGKVEYIITEISVQNRRSLKAHAKVGFQEFHRYTDQIDSWSLVYLTLG